MDGAHFDSLTRSLTTAGSRRRALGGLLAGTLGILGWHGGDEIVAHDPKATCKKKSGAAKKKCLKKAKKHAATHTTTQSPPSSPPPCPTERVCAGGCCPTGQTCQDGTVCVCPPDRPLACNGGCQECCTAQDCPPNPDGTFGVGCRAGQCQCRDGYRLCPSGTRYAGNCAACCDDAECPDAHLCTSFIQAPAQCNCPSTYTCDGVCIPGGCGGKCYAQCSTPGEPCCTGKGALICREEGGAGSGSFSCQLP